jgi:hypothetical protein
VAEGEVELIDGTIIRHLDAKESYYKYLGVPKNQVLEVTSFGILNRSLHPKFSVQRIGRKGTDELERSTRWRRPGWDCSSPKRSTSFDWSHPMPHVELPKVSDYTRL